MAKVQVAHKEIALTHTTDDNATLPFKIPKWALFVGVLVPNITDGVVGIEISIDKGSNYYPLADPADGADVEIVANTSNPAWIDFSDFLRFIHPNALVRFTTATQSGSFTFTLLFKG